MATLGKILNGMDLPRISECQEAFNDLQPEIHPILADPIPDQLREPSTRRVSWIANVRLQLRFEYIFISHKSINSFI